MAGAGREQIAELGEHLRDVCGSGAQVASRFSTAVDRRYARSDWTHGQYGGAPATSQARPQSTR